MNPGTTIHNPKELLHNQKLKFYTPIAMLFVSLFLVVNIISQKIVPIGNNNNIMLTAGDFVFPITYTLSIILTEVYGYTMSRRIIWSAFICNLFVTAVILFAVALPAASSWQEQEQYATILGRTPRLLAASFGAFLIGEFIGTYILAKMKIFTSGKYLWFRAISATSIGQLIDSITFTVIAFASIISWHNIIVLGISAYWCKMIYQILMTPGIYAFAKFLKKRENVDIFDRDTNFNPFNLELK
jgi:queuosine precursor transporter